MGTELQIERSSTKHNCSPNATEQLQCWLVDQLTILAAALGQTVTGERLRIYAEDLATLPREQLQGALTRARRELRFFPTIAELRDFAGANQEQRDDVEAQAAFELVIRHLEHEGVDAGTRDLPPRVQYALRQCGGLFLFNRRLQVHYGDDENPSEVEDRSYQFLLRDFTRAYKAFSAHQEMADELRTKGLLPAPVRAFLQGKTEQSAKPMLLTASEVRTVTKAMPPIQQPLTPEQIRDRRQILKQQVARLMEARQ